MEVSEDELVLRPEITKRLKKIFQPYTHFIIWFVEVGRGVIYVDVPASLDLTKFGDAFGKALNFTFEEHISYTIQLIRKMFSKTEDILSKWERALDAFKREAEVYKAKNGKPPVIIYDNVSRLIADHPRILDVLQDDAKDNADDRKYIAVFVSSEGGVPRRMELMEIGDLSEKESKDYLINKRNIKEDAKKFYKLVGGRIMDLKIVADKFIDGKSLEDIKNSILNEIEKKFNTAQLLRKQYHHEIGKRVIHALLESKNKELKFTTFMEYFNNYKEANEVLENNVFAYHPENNVVTFQSQSVESYIRENTDIFVNLIDLTPQEGTSSNRTNK
ncbi:10558_t:CDS:2 [Acaulospora morrowiae]|uniref:10558_t:CDS:1 n=1 Tax=Acaulospora morrowiae TaxID=94023 RepID=A0A9N9BWQ4_9GLOM|nr:10558_t:CDS:2 [Acaulospora morrowiae]